jgi:hypothetical protein
MGGRKAEYGMQVGLECPLVSVNAVDEKKWWQDFYSWKRDSLWVRV